MRKFVVSATSFLLFSFGLYAQTSKEILMSVENNNVQLKTLKKEAEAKKVANRDGLTLDDPELSVKQLFGTAGVAGNETELGLSQSFDFATLSGAKKKLTVAADVVADVEYQVGRQAVLLEAKQTVVQLISINAQLKLAEKKLQTTQMFNESMQKRLEKGDASIIEANQAAIQLIKIKTEKLLLENEKNTQLAKLARLNGGLTINFDESEYESVELPADFDSWFAGMESKLPQMQLVNAMLEKSHAAVSQSKKQNWPSFSVGYTGVMSEGEQQHGATVGVSLPLWANRNSVKLAKAEQLVAESKVADERLLVEANLRDLYQKAQALGGASREYRKVLEDTNVESVLKKAFDAKAMTVHEYVGELQVFYEMKQMALEAERDYQLALAELLSCEL